MPPMKKRIDKIEELLRSHQEHLEIANSEMGIIKNDISWLKNIFIDFKEIIEKLDTRVWTILTMSVFGVLIQIAFKLWK